MRLDSSSNTPAGDVLDQIRKLGDLGDAGLVTPEELEGRWGAEREPPTRATISGEEDLAATTRPNS